MPEHSSINPFIDFKGESELNVFLPMVLGIKFSLLSLSSIDFTKSSWLGVEVPPTLINTLG